MIFLQIGDGFFQNLNSGFVAWLFSKRIFIL